MRHTRKKLALRTLSVKVPPEISAKVVRLAAERQTTVSAVVRDAIETYDAPMKGSFVEQARKFIGAASGGPVDLATNPKHLKGFGTWRH